MKPYTQKCGRFLQSICGSRFQIIGKGYHFPVLSGSCYPAGTELGFDNPVSGRSIVYSSDTEPCPAVRRLAAGANLLIHEATGGVPRLVNQLCDYALVYAFNDGRKRVMRLTVQRVLDDGVFFGGGATVREKTAP